MAKTQLATMSLGLILLPRSGGRISLPRDTPARLELPIIRSEPWAHRGVARSASTAIADVFDALSTRRPYKSAISFEKCFLIMEQNRGSHFDPNALDAFFRRKSDVVRTFQEYAYDTEE